MADAAARDTAGPKPPEIRPDAASPKAGPEAGTPKAAPPKTGKAAKAAKAGTPKAGNLKAGRPARRSQNSVVPRASVAGRSLVFVVAIITALASLTLGAVALVADRADAWAADVSREATVQVRPRPELDMEVALADIVRLAEATPGVEAAEIVPEAVAAELLEPWLGAGFDLSELPVPRLVALRIGSGALPDFADLAARLEAEIPEASLDDHRVWVSRLARMARTTIFLGLAVLSLVVAAGVLIVVFATRAAMAGNADVIEVLHFVGADRSYIAQQFQAHFLLLGLRGAGLGGLAALALLALAGLLGGGGPSGDPAQAQVEALFGTFALGAPTVVGILILVVLVALMTAVTSRLTVLRTLGALR